MNLVEADVGDGFVEFAGYRIPTGPGAARPAEGRAIVGIRPEAFEDAALADPSLPQIDVVVDVVEELGPETHVIFPVAAAPVDVTGARADDEADEALLFGGGAVFTARVDPLTTARPGADLRLAVDPSRFHFFDPATGEALDTAATPRLVA